MALNYVTDTHSLVWYFTDDRHLSKKALKSFESTVKEGQIIVPTVVLAEILFIAKKGRTSLGFTATVAKIEELANFEIAALDLDVLKIAESIDAPLEMHDKLIVATAIHYDACLITRDEQITKSKIVKTIW
jgi:PIN domain nuclease of toxin-antitoxin system